jgi:hypothetical protein
MMKDLDERIAETLYERAPVFVHPMPRGTAVRVRGRQMLASFGVIALVALVAVGAVGVWSAAPRASQPASRQTVPPPAGFLPRPQGTQGGAQDATDAPASSWATNQDTTAHDTNSTVPYTEQVDGQESYLLTPKDVVAYGHVDGVEWSLAAYATRAYNGIAFPRFLGGPCGDLMIGDQGEYGGIHFCLHTDETDPSASLSMAGFGNQLDPQTDPIIGYAGLVGDGVKSVELNLTGGETTVLPLYDAPPGIDARYFQVFVPKDTAGRIVARAADGTVLGTGGLCLSSTPIGPDNVGCGHGLEDVSSVVATLVPPPTGG